MWGYILQTNTYTQKREKKKKKVQTNKQTKNKQNKKRVTEVQRDDYIYNLKLRSSICIITSPMVALTALTAISRYMTIASIKPPCPPHLQNFTYSTLYWPSMILSTLHTTPSVRKQNNYFCLRLIATQIHPKHIDLLCKRYLRLSPPKTSLKKMAVAREGEPAHISGNFQSA